ncbi:NAD-dependent epimerase/dehydratase family protein [Paludibaculum fermentans]|uniref:NAD-dependent epimerase/dehydratase family protein n=1 Tax=Paludibaculum fermentans TaxID=1473598 RepID=UPI003EBEE27D
MRVFITGAAGFIGSSLVDRYLELGHTVVGYDNFSTGQESFLEGAAKNPRFQLVRADLGEFETLRAAMRGADLVLHLAANADVRFGTDHPRRDLEQNTIFTWNVAECARLEKVPRIGFSSTGSVYGEAAVIPTPEDCPMPVQTSLYGASKLAAEGILQAYSEGFGIQVFIFRFVSILGERYTHGHVFDFVKRLGTDPTHLHILGNGLQRKSYLYIQDCLDAIVLAVDKAEGKTNVFNLGTDEYCELNDSVRYICGRLGVQPEFSYSGGDRGWIGDNPFIWLECSRIRALGWKPKLTIRAAVERTVDYLVSSPELLHARD